MQTERANRSETRTIAMWSGPRNLSTAMMRSFAQRPDTQVWDEPFYAAYLRKTGIEHPMRDEVMAAGIGNYDDVIAACLEAPKPPNRIFYQKHMTQHMIEGVDLSWIDRITNAFLIRSPQRVLASYAKKRGEVSAVDLGYGIQKQMFDRQADKLGRAPVVIDSSDIREKPEQAMRALCEALEIEFFPGMLGWKKGPSPDDGVWARHWYDAIWKSTGFAPPEALPAQLPDDLLPILDEVMDDYLAVAKHKLQI